MRAASPQHTWLVYSVSRRKTSNRDEAAPDKADRPTGRLAGDRLALGTRAAGRCSHLSAGLAAAGRAEAGAGRRAGPLGAGPPRAPPAGPAGRRRAQGRPLAHRRDTCLAALPFPPQSPRRGQPSPGTRSPRAPPPALPDISRGSLSPLPEAGRRTTRPSTFAAPAGRSTGTGR